MRVPLMAAALLLAPPIAAAPNMVVIDICSVRADHMGTYGYKRNTTPRMDALARTGAVFENVSAVGSWCLPNYATLFTGRYPESHGLYSNSVRGIPQFHATLAEKLKEAGYETAAFSGGVYLLPEWGMDRGFDHYVNSFSSVSGNRHPAPLAANLDEVGKWLRERNNSKGNPFFLYVAVDNLHAPIELEGPIQYDHGYAGVASDTRTMGVPFARAYSGEPDGYPESIIPLVSDFKSNPSHLNHYIARYDSALRETDSQVGRFLDKLKALGLDKKTIIVLTGDHGETLGEHDLLGHTQGLYETNLKTPLIIRDQSSPAISGKRFKQLVERADIMPTLLDWAGVDASALALPGRSLLPLLHNTTVQWRQYAFASSRRNFPTTEIDPRLDERMVRDERWKLHYYSYKKSYELYDLKNDPGETKDVAAEQPAETSRLSFELMKWLENNRPHQPGPADVPVQKLTRVKSLQ